MALVCTWRVNRSRVVVHRGSSLGHAGIHKRRHHHPAGIKPKDMWGIIPPLGMAWAWWRRMLPMLQLEHLFLNRGHKHFKCWEKSNASNFMVQRMLGCMSVWNNLGLSATIKKKLVHMVQRFSHYAEIPDYLSSCKKKSPTQNKTTNTLVWD